MSLSGKFTPLNLNVLGELAFRRGFTINPGATARQGLWTGIAPEQYTQGSVTSTTVLRDLTYSLPLFYRHAQSGRITVDTWRRLISLGQSVCPGLGNSRPDTFAPSYPGYGSWQGATLLSDSYPPRDYPITSQYSYIQQERGSYAWIMGWPGRNGWQRDTDTYRAAYVPQNNTSLVDFDEYFSQGFIATPARQAYYEMYTGRFDQYNNIVNSFSICAGWRGQQDQEIASLVNSRNFMSATYSNINDLTTNDISGVNLAFAVWGQDLLNSGKVIDLKNIHRFGVPSVLLQTLQTYNAVTPAVKLALYYSDLNSQELDNIFNPDYIPTPTEERKIYDAFKLVQGDDLYSLESGVTIQLNCTIPNLSSLADLLDPKKLFPNSYRSLTIPQYRVDLPTSKIYYFIYSNSGVNQQVQPLSLPLSDYLIGILPDDIAIACGAFSVSMQQIKNVMQIEIEKFSLSVADLEVTGQNLPTLNTTTGIPVNLGAVDQLLSLVSLGSGNQGGYRQCDFFGAAAGYPYEEWYDISTRLLRELGTPLLAQIYSQMYQLALRPLPPEPVPPDPPIPDTMNQELIELINLANQEINRIYGANSTKCNELNYYWDRIGNHLFLEQRAMPYALPIQSESLSLVSHSDFKSFVSTIPEYGLDVGDGESAQILERISDLGTLGGQSIVASMREARNAERLAWSGIPPENDVSDEIELCSASATATIDGQGRITSVTVTEKSSGYTVADPPTVDIYPYGFGGKLVPVIETDGSISSFIIEQSGSGYPYVDIVIEPPPQCQYRDRTPSGPAIIADRPVDQPVIGGKYSVPEYLDTGLNTKQTTPSDTFPGTGPFTEFSENPYLPGPPILPPPSTASPTVDEAIDEVTICNCDCWNISNE
jgi:hypothetical protein